MSTKTVLEEISKERSSQDKKWGEQNHDMADWYTILGEEVGAVGKAICEHKLQKIYAASRIREELVQVAAVAVSMIESYDRNNPPERKVVVGFCQEAQQ